MVPVTEFVAVSITVTVVALKFVTNAFVPSEETATLVGPLPTVIVADTVLFDVLITDRFPDALLQTYIFDPSRDRAM